MAKNYYLSEVIKIVNTMGVGAIVLWSFLACLVLGLLAMISERA